MNSWVPSITLVIVVSACAPHVDASARSRSQTSVEEPTESLKVAPSAFALVGDDDVHAWVDEARVLDCAQGTTSTEDAMRVESGLCRYGVWSTHAEARVSASTLRLTFWHDGLIGTTPDEVAEGHFGVAIDGDVVVDAIEAIPSGAAWRSVEVSLPGGVDAGARIELHLHNHGANHWGFGPLSFEVNR
jgi:hypothetical protein